MGTPSLLISFSHELLSVLVLTAVRGAGLAILSISGSTALMELAPAERRGEAAGIYGFGITIPSLLVLPASVALAERFGFGWVFLLGAIPLIGIPSAVLVGRTLLARQPVEQPEAQTGTVRQILPHVLRPALIILVAAMAVTGGLMTFLPQMVSSSRTAATALLVLGVAGALGRWQSGRMGDRFGASRLQAPALLCTALGFVATAMALHDANANPRWLLMVSMAIVGFGYGSLQSLTLVDTFTHAAPHLYGSASAAWNIAGNMGFGLGGVLLGAMASAYGFSTSLIVCAVVLAGAVLLRQPRGAP